MTTLRRSLRCLLLAWGVLLTLAIWAVGQAQTGAVHVMKPRDASTAATTSSGNLIDHGGLVLPTSTTYVIWWGDTSLFPGDQMVAINSLLQGFAGSDYLSIANQYMRGGTAATSFGENLFDPSPPPRASPAGSNIITHVCEFLHSRGIPIDPKNLYFVYTNNFPANANYCGFHGYQGYWKGSRLHVAYIPNLTGIAGCDLFDVPPGNLACNNYSEGTQAAANVTAHEFMESITDTDIFAWYDAAGAEIGDKCNFQFSSCVKLANKTEWQLQEEWSNEVSGCVQQTATR